VYGCIEIVFTKQSTYKADKACAAMRSLGVQYCWSGMAGDACEAIAPAQRGLTIYVLNSTIQHTDRSYFG